MSVQKIDFTTLSELGLRRLDLSEITISESCSKSPSILISQDGELVARLGYTDLKKAVEFMQSVISYEQQSANKLLDLERENNELRADAARLDWLADKDNEIGNVQLPTHCVTANIGCLRDAIDMAMREQYHENDNMPDTLQELRDAAAKNKCAWQPIETAPRDGTWVLLCCGRCDSDEDDNNERPVVAQWTNYLNGRTAPKYGRWQFAWYDGGYYGEYESPTHWMPLPDTPQRA